MTVDRFKWIRAVAPFVAIKKIKIRRSRRSAQILTRHADKCAGEIWCARNARFIRKYARVELLRQPAPVFVHTFDTIREVKPLVINLHPQMHRLADGDGDGRREGVGLRRVRRAGHHAQMFASLFIVRDVEVMKLRAVVVADQARHLLEMFRLEFHNGRGAKAMRLLAASDE